MSNANGRRPPRHPDEQRLAEAAEASAALRQLLAAASAPPSVAELKGRSQAIAAFRAVHQPVTGPQPALSRTGQPASERRAPAKLARVGRWSAARLTVAGAALALLLGGTAAAAAAGELPVALQNAVSDLLNPPAGVGSPPAPDRSSAVPTARPAPGRSHTFPPQGPPTTTGSASGTAARPPGPAAGLPQLAALCRAYQAASSPAETLARPGFAPLVTAADGVAGVAGFCSRLTGPARTVAPSSRSAAPQSRNTQTTSSQPVRSQPASAHSASSQQASSQPASAHSASSQQASSQPASAHPASSQQVSSQPSGPHSARSQSAYSNRPSGGRYGGSRVSPALSGAWRGGSDQASVAATSMD